MPGIRSSFEVNIDGLTSKMAEYARLSQSAKPKGEIIRNQLALMLRAVIDLTPFDTLAQGRTVVHRDLLRAVKPYGGEDGSFSKVTAKGLRERLASYLRSRAYDKIKDVFDHLNKKGGYYSGWQFVDFSPALHHQVQSRRGRVDTDHRVLTPQVQEWKNYLAQLQQNVGRARGGWTKSAQAVGLSLPQWVTRHGAGGAVQAIVQPGLIQFTFTNRSVFIPDYRTKVELALAGREKAMAADLRRMYAGFTTHAGFGR
jgi:hypothetical protein